MEGHGWLGDFGWHEAGYGHGFFERFSALALYSDCMSDSEAGVCDGTFANILTTNPAQCGSWAFCTLCLRVLS